ncbi:pyridoxamine 5'-phosphate oxidase family protein [Dyadobacter sp. 3J3]|uniref:pyridoxamine 5'-phosphate oxidase family protein n=1 Tax=Dyadobacter sp. 3J3 TaxID=2606600 RepID=UPI00135C69BA|nr:pyridoxamine 5'-phosphate oxidase family protein [Dyadobacter sp. 3J3]
MNYAQLAFSDATKALQEEFGSRKTYEKVEKFNVVYGLTGNETSFIEDQDHFYMASIGENGYPYIQHRGGPKNFIKILDNKTLAFVDFIGNKQYISVGNIETNPNVALIMISYPHKARLKIFAKAQIVSISENPELFEKIDPADYKHRPERMLVLNIQAYDWNCPQHIIPRYTTEEIDLAYEPNRQYVHELEEENKKLKKEIEALKKL